MERIIRISSLTIDLKRVRAIKLNNFNDVGETNILNIEYNTRIEYSKNPFTNEVEKTEIKDVITKTYPDFETAQIYQGEIEKCWREYLNEK